jgi:GPH family glycoside/pentoside/hexuronide:cation symporter
VTNPNKLPIKEKVGYGLGDAASNLYFQIFVNFLMFFYTDIFGIPAAAVGTMFLVSRIWDAVNDPIMGIIADRTETKWGKFRPYLIWVSVPLAIIGVFTFITPDFSVTGKIIYAYATYILIMMAYTAINIPYSALMGVLSPNTQERPSISTYRFVLAYVGLFMVQGLTMKWVNFFGKGNQAVGFPYVMGIFGVMATIMFFITFATTKERVQPPSSQKSNLKNDLQDLYHNKPWMILLIMSISTLTYVIIRSGSVMYFFKYNMTNEKLAPTFMVMGTVAVIIGVACTDFLTKLVGKKRLYTIVMALCSIFTILFYFIPEDNIILIFIVHIIISFVMAPQAPLLWAMYADTADYSHWKNGRRATGLVFSAATFAQKFGIALGGAVSGWILAAFGFIANQPQTPEALHGIRLMMSLIPAVGSVIATIAIFFYQLDDKTMEKIEADIRNQTNG